MQRLLIAVLSAVGLTGNATEIAAIADRSSATRIATDVVRSGGATAAERFQERVSAAPLAVATVKMTGLARVDLAKRLKVAEKQIEIVSAKPATWPNAGLGCPSPERTYKDEVVAGFVIELTHRDKTYRYHSDMSSQVVYCPDKAK